MAEEIWHHGVKGQKWGVRHTPEQLGHKTGGKAGKRDDSHEDYKNAHDTKSVKKMSDSELRSRLNRLNMEKQYSQMNPSRIERGRKVLTATLNVAGTVAAATSTAITLRKNYSTIASWFNRS